MTKMTMITNKMIMINMMTEKMMMMTIMRKGIDDDSSYDEINVGKGNNDDDGNDIKDDDDDDFNDMILQ